MAKEPRLPLLTTIDLSLRTAAWDIAEFIDNSLPSYDKRLNKLEREANSYGEQLLRADIIDRCIPGYKSTMKRFRAQGIRESDNTPSNIEYIVAENHDATPYEIIRTGVNIPRGGAPDTLMVRAQRHGEFEVGIVQWNGILYVSNSYSEILQRGVAVLNKFKDATPVMRRTVG